jgi:hypothetical protein
VQRRRQSLTTPHRCMPAPLTLHHACTMFRSLQRSVSDAS